MKAAARFFFQGEFSLLSQAAIEREHMLPAGIASRAWTKPSNGA